MNALTPTHTKIYFTVIRLVEQTTDIVITLNVPHFVDGLEGEATQQEVEQANENTYRQILTSFAIKDWDLFSSE